MMHISLVNPSSRAERGIVLVFVAVFLVVLGSLGVAGMRSANVQERLSGVFYDRAVALAASDAALSDGFQYLQKADFDFSAAGSKVRDGIPLYSSSAADGLTAKSWVSNNVNWLTGSSVFQLGEADGISGKLERVKDNPSYVIDRFPNTGITTTTKYQVYRVTARGGGGRAENSVYTHYLSRIAVPSGS